MSIFNVFTLMGGIAMFLYGMDLMGKALEQTAGSKLQGILSKMTASPVRGLLLGMVITAVIQSSGATTVMAVGFVNSGLMELHQAIGVIMGANIGTTVTGWLLSLSGLEGDSFAIQMLNPNAWAPHSLALSASSFICWARIRTAAAAWARSWWAFPS